MAICASPDFLLCVNGQFVAMELKDTGGRLTKLQEYKLGEIARCGGISIVCSPENWEATKEMLVKLNGGQK